MWTLFSLLPYELLSKLINIITNVVLMETLIPLLHMEVLMLFNGPSLYIWMRDNYFILIIEIKYNYEVLNILYFFVSCIYVSNHDPHFTRFLPLFLIYLSYIVFTNLSSFHNFVSLWPNDIYNGFYYFVSKLNITMTY